MKDRVREQLAKLDEKLKKLTRMRLEDEITRESYFEFKREIEKEKLDLLSKRREPDAGMVPNGNPEDPAKKVEDSLLAYEFRPCRQIRRYEKACVGVYDRL